MSLTDDELIQELNTRFANSRKAFADLSVLNHKLLEMNRRLEQSEALKSNFLSNIRCEINNPLNVIIGLAAQLADSDVNRDIDISTIASLICAEATNLDFQLRNIIVAAELEAGDADVFLANVDVSGLVTRLAESYNLVAAHKDVRITVNNRLDSYSPVIATDTEKLQIIVSNLLANAIEFSLNGGMVELVIAQGKPDGIILSVRDFGVGIAAEDQQRVFDRFTQLHTGASRTHPGYGLGLSICRALTDLLQGRIELESTPGEGTIFSVCLPSLAIVNDGETVTGDGSLFFFDEMEKA